MQCKLAGKKNNKQRRKTKKKRNTIETKKKEEVCDCFYLVNLRSDPLALHIPGSNKKQTNTMNLERLPNEEKLSLCRKYYLGGFAFLPFLWLVNVVWFFKEAFVKPVYTEQLQIKTYVKRSALGLLFWVTVLTTWITIFQRFRAEWGEVGDYLSFTIPLGIP